MAYVFEDAIEFLDELTHYGMPKRSGRYPYGSGDNPYQRTGDFLARVEELAKRGYSEKQIADEFGMSTSQLRTQKSLAKHERRNIERARAIDLRNKGYSLNDIAEKMGYNNDSSIRALLNDNTATRKNQAQTTADFLKSQVDEKGMIDVGKGVERYLNVSKERLNESLQILQDEGYEVYGGRVPQVTNPGNFTTVKVLCKPGTEHKEIYDFENVKSVEEYTSHDGGETFDTFVYPKSMSSKRIHINYAEDGGIEKDGLIEIRRNIEDLDLGGSKYSQVRILVDDNKYLKGMAVYSDNLPDGVDIVFNTNKKKGTPVENVLKDIKKDPSNPFGAYISPNGQSYYYDKNGKRQLSLINKHKDEGEWDKWSKNLPSQFLSKQNMSLINKQLELTKADKKAEFDTIMSLTNPTIKKHLLNSFADDCDAAAVHLKAAALPRQRYQVILPVPSLKDNEVYAPNYKNGEKVALIRYPHGGTFEIPICTVNNKNPDARKMIGTNPIDAVCINSKVAERLSGADFDGDTVMVIPTGGKTKITSRPALKGLEGFDPKLDYGTEKKSDGYYNSSGEKIRVMKNTQTEMGKISNLITDMTLKGAKDEELARAVRHSMVVIDAEKHKLDYKKSEVDNDIAALKKKYQGRIENGRYKEGASTLISKAKSEERVAKRVGARQIDKDTGEVSYKTDTSVYYDKKGTPHTRTQVSTKMAEAKDARRLSSGTAQEEAYASYANYMKSLANKSRKNMVNTKEIPYSKSANKTYKKEVDSLDYKLDLALKNAPKERAAQLMANSVVKSKKQANPDLTKEEIKKISQQALVDARIKTGAKRRPVEITDKEWEAIQSGAITKTKLAEILKHTDVDKLKERAMPREKASLNSSQISLIKSMSSSGYTTAEIANRLGISSSTVSKYLR